MGDDDIGHSERTLAELDWKSLPDKFDDECLDSLPVGTILRIRREGANHLTPERMASFTEALERRNADLQLQLPVIPSLERVAPLAGQVRTPLIKGLGRQPEVLKAIERQAAAANKLSGVFKSSAAAARVSAAVPEVAIRDLDTTLQKAAKRKAKKERQREEREQAMVELLAATSQSTAALARTAEGQQRRIDAQGLLTNFLAFAVVFDVINGAFDDHTSRTSGLAALGGLVAVGVTSWIGVLRAQRKVER